MSAMKTLDCDFSEPADANNLFWCEPGNWRVEVGETVMFGRDPDMWQGTVRVVDGDRVGVSADDADFAT